MKPLDGILAHAGHAVQAQAGSGHDHVVQFYESDDFLYDTISEFLAEGLISNEPLVVIATAEHREGISTRLQSRGLDLVNASRSGELILLDARFVLSTFMSGDMPDATLFRQNVGRIIENSLRGRKPQKVRAYGEMVDVLWREGNPVAAIRLEELWNELAETQSFSLLCAYAMGNFYSESHGAHFEQICQAHSHVRPAESFSLSAPEDVRSREVTLLQQRARSLEAEIEQRKALETALRVALAERQKTEAALRVAKEEAERANHVKSQFLAVMSHELRTPLNAIIGYEDLLNLEVGGPVNEDQRRFLSRIRSGAQQLHRLVDQVLSLARIEAGKEELAIESVDVVAIASEAVTFLEPIITKKGLTLALRTPSFPVICATDAGKLRQILLNLLSNAEKFTSSGGVQLEIRVDDGFVFFAVGDTGVGIEAAYLEKIFDPFVQVDSSATRHFEGTGLGLSVSRHLARLLGGDIIVSSVRGSGSVFTLSIPR